MWRVGASREGLPSEQGINHKFRDFLQWYGLQRLLQRSILETIFVLIILGTILVLLLPRNDSRARDSRNESRADDDSRNELSTNVDSRNGLCVEVDLQKT